MPALWLNSFYGLTQFKHTQISNLPLPNDINRSNKRLGKLAEDLFSFWAKNQPDLTIIFENLQIIDKKQTIGELDVCLFSSSTNKHIHLELITKFYLYNPDFDCNSIDAWIGPNRNDSLKNKVEKLTNKQLPLLNNPVTKERLSEYTINTEEIEQQVCFKTWLFVPLNFNKKLTLFNPKCITGHYMTLDVFTELHSNNKTYFCPTKQDWLRFPETQKKWNNFNEVIIQIKLFMEAQQAIMVWIKNYDLFERIIIVPYKEF